MSCRQTLPGAPESPLSLSWVQSKIRSSFMNLVLDRVSLLLKRCALLGFRPELDAAFEVGAHQRALVAHGSGQRVLGFLLGRIGRGLWRRLGDQLRAALFRDPKDRPAPAAAEPAASLGTADPVGGLTSKGTSERGVLPWLLCRLPLPRLPFLPPVVLPEPRGYHGAAQGFNSNAIP